MLIRFYCMAIRFTRMLYMKVIKGIRFLMASELPQHASYMDLSYRIGYQVDMIHGVSRNSIDDHEFLAMSLQEGIHSGFIVSNFVLLTLDEITVALKCNQSTGTYSLFDSPSRDVAGKPTSDGVAVLLSFDCIEDLSQYLLRLYPKILFNITPVIFSDASVNSGSSFYRA